MKYPYHVQDELSEKGIAVGIKKTVKSPSKTIVTNPSDGFMIQTHEIRYHLTHPFTNGIKRDPCQDEIPYENFQSLRRRHLRPWIWWRKMSLKKLRKPQSVQNLIDNRQGSDQL